MMTTHVQLWSAWLFIYAGLPLAWASVGLHLLTPWRRTEVGRHLLAYASVVAVILTFTAIRWWFFRRSPFPDWLQIAQLASYAALVAVMAWRVVLQFRATRRVGLEPNTERNIA